MIEVNGITKHFGMVKAVDNVSFDIQKGEVVGFLGPNGAGKTTTMRILTCFMPADGGEARVGGHDVIEESMAVRSRIGYLPENAPLYLDMAVDEFLDYVANIRGIPAEDKAGAIQSIAESCGLVEVMKKDIGELSKGYRQRVGLAQAMIHNPDILILDEPTSGLDPNQIQEIRSLIKKLGKEKTVILSTHILSEVEATCDRVLIISNGRIVADGTVDEIAGRAAGGNIHTALIRGEKEKVEGAIKKLNDVISCVCRGDEGGLSRWEITGREGVHLGEQIFRAIADLGFSLAELKREQKNLESVFSELTLRPFEPSEEADGEE